MIKIYCDNNMLFHNIDRHKTEPKSAAELTALEKLMELRRSGKILMFRSRVVRAELEQTKAIIQRDKLQADYDALDQIPKDEKKKLRCGIALVAERSDRKNSHQLLAADDIVPRADPPSPTVGTLPDRRPILAARDRGPER